jgi:hypothetical protein
MAKIVIGSFLDTEGEKMAKASKEKELIDRILGGVEVQGLNREAVRGQQGR